MQHLYCHWWFVLIGTIVFIGLLSYGFKINPDNAGWFNLYLQIGTTTVFIINLMLALDTYRQQAEDRHKSYYHKYSGMSQVKLNDIDKMFFMTPILNRLYFEMYASDPNVQEIKRLIDKPIPVTPEMLKAEHHASSIVFQTMANIYMTGLSDRNGYFKCEDLVEWYNSFKKWMQSKILQRHWRYFQDEYHPKFRHFMEGVMTPSP